MLADDIDAGRGHLICAPDDPPPVARRLEARLCWMADAPAKPGARYVLKHTTRRVRARIESIDARLDVERLEDVPHRELELNDIGLVHLDLAAPVMAEPYERNRVTGAFILVDETTNATVAAGMVLERARGPGPARAARTARTSSGTSRRCRGASAGRCSACAARPSG